MWCLMKLIGKLSPPQLSYFHPSFSSDSEVNSVKYELHTVDTIYRLFEMGFAEQLQEILNRLPETRQTLLFSATLPKLLVEFAKAGLHDPTLIRLDVDTKISSQLKVGHQGHIIITPSQLVCSCLLLCVAICYYSVC